MLLNLDTTCCFIFMKVSFSLLSQYLTEPKFTKIVLISKKKRFINILFLGMASKDTWTHTHCSIWFRNLPKTRIKDLLVHLCLSNMCLF
jgi:hypothetical protein